MEPMRDRVSQTLNILPILKDEKTNFISILLQKHLANWQTFFSVTTEKGPM